MTVDSQSVGESRVHSVLNAEHIIVASANWTQLSDTTPTTVNLLWPFASVACACLGPSCPGRISINAPSTRLGARVLIRHTGVCRISAGAPLARGRQAIVASTRNGRVYCKNTLHALCGCIRMLLCFQYCKRQEKKISEKNYVLKVKSLGRPIWSVRQLGSMWNWRLYDTLGIYRSIW